jgi:hypothetical protein
MTRTQLCLLKERRCIVADGADLQMPKLMRHGDVRFGGEDFELRMQIEHRRGEHRRIDSIRRWTRDAIGAEHPRLCDRQVAIHNLSRIVSPVVKGVLMSVDERERREHRDCEHAEQNLQTTKRK